MCNGHPFTSYFDACIFAAGRQAQEAPYTVKERIVEELSKRHRVTQFPLYVNYLTG